MKRWAALALSAIGFLGISTPAAAAGPSAAPSKAVAATGTRATASVLGLTVEPGKGTNLALAIDPGASRDNVLLVANRTGDLRLTVRLSATDAVGSPATGPAAWIAFSDDVLVVEPGAFARVSMAIAVPHNTQPGNTLAHVVARVESAALVADGSPRQATAQASLTVVITMNGAPSAQLSIIDVRRVDDHDTHQLAVVMRNFGDQATTADGTMRVAGDRPQSLHFHSQLAARRDTTVLVPWDAPPIGTGADIAVDANYGDGNIASWAAPVGGTPPTTVGSTPVTDLTPTSVPATAAQATSTPSASKPWSKGALVPMLILLAVALAATWFVFELRSSRRRRTEMPMQSPFFMAPPGWGGGSGDASVELAKQLVALTEVIVRLVTNDDEVIEKPSPRARARSPGAPAWYARAGPPPTVGEAAAETVAHATDAEPDSAPTTEDSETTSPAFSTPDASARPEEEPHAIAMDQLLALDRERRRLRKWMDATEGESSWTTRDALEGLGESALAQPDEEAD
jgi:hypothetical protein